MLALFTMFSIKIYYLIGYGKSEYYPNNSIPNFELSKFIIVQPLIAFGIISCIIQIGKFLVSVNSAKWYFRSEKEILSPTRESIYHVFDIIQDRQPQEPFYFNFVTQPKQFASYFNKNKIRLSKNKYFVNSKSLTLLAFNGDNLFTASKKYSQSLFR
ncbi:hypothetical protein pb186bvf_011340 [Paramecium bursaria]